MVTFPFAVFSGDFLLLSQATERAIDVMGEKQGKRFILNFPTDGDFLRQIVRMLFLSSSIWKLRDARFFFF